MTHLEIYREIPKDRYLEKVDMKKIILSILDSNIERLKKIDGDHLPDKFSLDSCVYGYMTHVLNEITYLKGQRSLIANEK